MRAADGSWSVYDLDGLADRVLMTIVSLVDDLERGCALMPTHVQLRSECRARVARRELLRVERFGRPDRIWE